MASRSFAVFALVCLLVPAAARAEQFPAVRELRNIPYFQGGGADPVRHRLDLYLPEGRKDFPVIVFVHGGAWTLGDKSFFGWGPDIGRYFARRGFGVVMPSYRLSPAVKHPEHVKDLARAVAWTVRHVTEYGGNPRELFLCGHSAGGHLVSLLATDPSYLKAEGLSPSLIRGVVSVSGVYRIPVLNLGFSLPGLAADLVGAAYDHVQVSVPLAVFNTAFGSDPKECAAASPLNHVTKGLPPFLLINADHDWPLLPQMARDFARALKAAQCDVQELRVPDRGHEDVMFLASSRNDPVARAIERFVRGHRPAAQ
jgi:acetyl esterase/lipase